MSVSAVPYLSLLADNGDCVLEFDIVEKALQEDVGDSYQVVVLLRFIERVAEVAVCPFTLENNTNQNTGSPE